jgi:hypothetical protein
MSEAFPKGNLINPINKSPAARLEDGLQSVLARYERERLKEDEQEDSKTYMVTRFGKAGEDMFPDRQQEYADFIKSLLDTQFDPVADLSREIAKRFVTFALQYYSPEEYENRLRTHTAEKNNWITINEALTYEPADATHIKLHIPMMITKTSVEWSELFMQGLHELAQRLSTDPSLKDVQEICGSSKLVSDYPRVARALGFAVSKDSETSPKSRVLVSREDFIKRYGNPTISK